MPQPDNVKALYNELKNTYELGSEEDFIKYLSDDKNREALRKELESEYDVGDIASFSNYLGFGTGQAAYEQYMAQRNGQSAPAAPTAAQQQPVKPMGAAATLPSWKTSAMPDDVRKRFERQEAQPQQQPTQEPLQPLGPERFQKQMEMQQAVGSQMQSFNNKINAISENGKPFGKPIDALAPARQQRLQKEANDKLNESLNIATLGITQNTQPAREAWNQAGLRTQKDWRFGKLISNEASYLKNHDLDRMSEEAWNNIPTDRKQTAIRKVSQVLRGQNPELSYGEALQMAERVVRAKSDQMMYDMAVEQNAPKGWLDYLTRKINDNAIGSILEGVARHKAGTIGDMQAREEATQQYANDNWFGGLVGDVAAMTLAPEMWIGGGVAGGALKGGTAIAGRAAGKAAVREGMSTLAGRMATKGLTSGVNLATFNAIGEAAGQAKHGGKIEGVDEETGRYVIGDYSLGDVGKSALHGLGLGVVTGPTGELIGNVGTKLVNRTASTAGKAAIRGSQALASTVAEGTIFVAPEILSGDITFDDWKHSVEMMAAFKLQGGLKSAKERIAELRGKRENSRQGFETRLRTMLDKSPNLALTKDEKAELERGGYKDLADLVEGYKNTTTDQRKAIETRQPIYLEPNENGEIPLNRFIDLVEDKNISEAARAKMYYYVTGHGLPQHTIVGSNFTEHTDDKGNTTYNVQSFSRDNGIVTSRTFKNKKEAENELARINRQAELNGVDMGEKHYNELGDAERMKDAYDIVAEQKGISGEALRRKLNRRPEEMDATEKAWAKEVQQAYDNLPQDAYKTSDDVRKAINSEYDVDVDDVLKKERARRTEKEQEALEEYTKRLFADVMPKEGQPNGTNDATRLLEGSGYDGVLQRISDDADMMAAEQREEAKKKQFRGEGENNGALRPMKINVPGVGVRDVYLTQGEIALTESGLVDPEKTKELNNVGTLTGYDPATGEEVQFTPADIVEVEPMTTAEQQEENIEANKQAYIQQQMDAATPTATTADNQQQEAEPAKPKGEPKEFAPGMVLTVKNNVDGNGEERKVVVVDGERYRLESMVPPKYVPSESGNYVKVMDEEGNEFFLNKSIDYTITDYQEPVSEEQPTETVEPTEQPTAEVPTAESITPQQQVTPESTHEPAPVDEVDPMKAPMPMKTVGTGKNKHEEEDWMSTTPERAYKYLYEKAVELGLPIKTVDNIVANNLKKAQDKVKRAETATGSIVGVLQKQNAAKAEVEYWEKVQKLRSQAMLAAAEAEAERTKEQRAAEAQRAAERREQRRNTEVGEAGSTPAEKYNSSKKIVGNKVSRTIADKTKIKGHYVLVEADALTPSHDPFNGWKVSEGFPTTEDGKSVNDRVYEGDKEAQDFTESIAQVYDGQAVSEIPVVSSEGIVYDGNGRTMAGQIAARNNTDAEYIEALTENAANFGFTEEQVQSMSHPRVVMQVDEDMPYNATTFARFNKDSKKKMNNVNKAVSIGKQMTDSARDAMLEIIDRYGTIDTFFGSEVAAADVVNMLVDGGFITQQEVPAFREKNSEGKMLLSADGRSFVTNTLLGTLFDEEAIRKLGNDKGLQNSLLRAIPQIAENRRLGEYALTDEINTTIDLLYEARKSGMTFDLFKRQGNLVEGLVEDRYEPMVVIMADLMSSGVDNFREFLTLYNQSAAADAASGGENLFGRRTKEDLKNAAVEYYKAQRNGQTDNTQAAAADTGRNENAETQPGVGGLQEGEGDRGAAAEQPAGEVAESREERDKRLEEERKQRILSEGTEYDKPFGLTPVSETMTADEIGANVRRIVEGLKANEGNGTLDTFEGFAYNGNYKKNAGHQVDGYLLSLTGVVPDATLRQWYESEGLKTRDDLRKLGEKLYAAEQPKQQKTGGEVKEALIKGKKWEKTGEPAPYKSSKKGDNYDTYYQIGKKRYGLTIADADTEDLLLKDYGTHEAIWNAYERGQVLLSPELAAAIKAKIEYMESTTPKQQKTGGEATKTSKRDRGLLEVVMDKLRNIIGDRLHTTLTEDEKGLINWARAKTKGTAPVFYSNAERAVEGIKQEKATAEQWLAMIQKAGGLKAGEDKWMGLSEWLNDHKGKSLTKQEVMDYIRDNQIRMEEVNYAEDGDYPNYAEEMATRRELVAFEDEMSEKYGNGWENKLNEAERLRFENLNSSLENYKKSESRPINDTRLKYTTDFLDNKREIALVVPSVESWNEGDEVHFGDAGHGRAVAWVRFGETTDADGKRVLVIDEIQSNRHQEGREKGYKPKIEFGDVVKSDDGKNWLFFGMTIDGQPRVDKMFVSHDEETVDDAKRRYIKEIAKNAIPDAPFEKNWHEVAMKRMLRYAAENGYDKVAWTTGEQQIERYDLAKQVDEIIYKKNEDGTYRISAIINGRGNPLGDNLTEDKLSDIVGKEIANKIVNSEGRQTEVSVKNPNPTSAWDNTKIEKWNSLVGEDLKVGGEGMKGFYDQILPRFMDKYGKKWGVKTTDVELPNVGDNGLTMHSVDVTPEMKKSVLEGQPMFHRVFHGSGADFERFDSSHMGEGEGAQAYGYGHYTTEVEGIGRTYAEESKGFAYRGMVKPPNEEAKRILDAIREDLTDGKKFEDVRKYWIDFLKEDAEKNKKRNDKWRDYDNKEEIEFVEKLNESDFANNTESVLYTVEIPDDNGSNYLEWDKKVDGTDRLFKALEDAGFKRMEGEDVIYGKDGKGEFLFYDNNFTGEDLYKSLSALLGSDKAASEFLHNAGFTGIKYPAQYRSGGREDNAKNYVIFDDGDLKITDKIKFFKTPQGEVYGFTVGGNIYVDMDIAKADTPIHEYGHLWVPMVRESDPEMWEDIKRVLTKDKDVKPFMDIVRQRYPELTAEGREDDFMEEVFTHFSGDNGLKMLEEAAREYEEQDGQGFISKAKAIAALNKVKEALNKFWGKVAQLFGIKFRNAREVANKMFKDFMDEVDPTKVREERIKNEGLKPEEEKTLMGVHNISEEKLRKALKQGGFANPSMAVIDTKHHMHTDYGDISLIPKSSLIDARTGKNAGTFTADAWTPSYPQTRLRPTSKGTSKFYKDMQAIDNEVGSELGSKLRLYFDSYLDSRDPDAMYWWYLHERGKNPKVEVNGNPFGKEITDKVMGVLDNGKKSLDDLSKEEMSQLVDIYHEYKRQKGEEVVSTEERIAIMKQRLANATGDDPEMQRRRERILNNIKEFEKYGEFYSSLNNFVDSIQNTLRRENELDHYSTFLNARKRVEDEGLKNDFNKWLEELNDRYGIESYIFNGYDNYGNQKWVKNTLNNVSRLMKQEGLNGAIGVSGIGNWIARVAKKVKTLDQIRAEKKNLKATEEEHDAFRSKWADILYDISRKLDEDDTFIGDNRMSEALDHSNPAEYIKQEYGIDLSKKDREAIDTFIKEVRETFPTGYFETKFERPVALDEFAVAVVPEGTSQDVVDALKNAGLDVRTYDGTSENRQAVTLDAVKGRDDIMFQKADNKSTEREVEPYKAPKKNDGEDLIDYAKRVAEDYSNHEDKKKNANGGIERAVESAKEAAEENKGEADKLKADYEAIGGKLADLRKAMSLQKKFDAGTVRRVTDLALSLIKNGQMDNLRANDVSRLLSAVYNSTGKEDIEDNLRRVVDIMIDSQLRNAEERLHKLESIRGSKVDAKGVVVGAKLDPAGQQYIQTFKEAKDWDEKTLESSINDAENDMDDSNDAIAEEAAWKASAYRRALEYVQNIKQSKADESKFKDELRKVELEIKADEEKIYDYISTPMKDAEGNEIMKNDGSGPRMHTVRVLKPEFKENVTEENQRVLDDTKRSIKQKKEAMDAIEETARQNRIERLQAYNDLMTRLSGSLSDSMTKAKELKEKEVKRVKDIHHMANSDMEGREMKGHNDDTKLQKFNESAFYRWASTPLATYEQMFRLFGRKNPDGKGYTYDLGVRGWADAADGEWKMQRSYYKKLDDKAKELFGKKAKKTYGDVEKKKEGMTFNYWDGAGWRDKVLNQDQMGYLYAVDKMPQGKATNRRMGFTDEVMEEIEKNLDPRLKKFIDWAQEELFPELRAECNEVYRDMFGADMDNIENYFPFVRDPELIKRDEEIGQPKQAKNYIGETTGALKKRTPSVTGWDIPNISAIDAIVKHIDEMSHWKNFARLNRDLNTLVHYKPFRQKVMGMNTVYGGGKRLMERFEKLCAIATGAYVQGDSEFDKLSTTIAKGTALNKVALRPFTAAKQLLSLPAFAGDANPIYLMEDLASLGFIPWYKSPTKGHKPWYDTKEKDSEYENVVQWAFRNLPNFDKRWASRTAGDYRLRSTQYDEDNDIFHKIMDKTQRGMIPNMSVDAWVCALGSHAVYKTAKDKYLRWGFDEEKAERRAIQDAEQFNKSQQSSEPAYLSTVQASNTAAAASAMLFRNSSTSYTREGITSARNLKRMASGEVTKEDYAKQMLRAKYGDMRDEFTEEEWKDAMKNAKRDLRAAFVRNTVNATMFGWFLPFLWRVGGKLPLIILPFLLAGGDDDKKKKAKENALDILGQEAKNSVFGPVEGLAYGDVMANALTMATGLAPEESKWKYIFRERPIVGEIKDILEDLDRSAYKKALYNCFNTIVGTCTGISLQTLSEWTAAGFDFFGADERKATEWALFVSRLLNCPQSQLNEVYFNEVGMNGEEAMKHTPQELAERWAKYEVKRGYLPWDWDDEELIGKKTDKAKKEIKERAERYGDKNVNDAYDKVVEQMQPIKEKESAYNKAKKNHDLIEAANVMADIQKDVEGWQRYQRYKMMQKQLDNAVSSYLKAETSEDANRFRNEIENLKKSMVEEIGN